MVTARSIHYSGSYREHPFIGVNCTAQNDNLLESELFGHEKGAFTGAVARKLGRFEMAGEGTLFLDEVGDTSLAMQSKLLRVLQERSFERVGGTKSIRSRCRVIAASNKKPEDLLASGAFREDLYYRLSLVVMRLPPLRERPKDIELLIDLFIRQANREYGRSVQGVSLELLERLKVYSWPGNLRQLKNVIANAIILSRGQTIEHIELLEAPAPPQPTGNPPAWWPTRGRPGRCCKRVSIYGKSTSKTIKIFVDIWIQFCHNLPRMPLPFKMIGHRCLISKFLPSEVL